MVRVKDPQKSLDFYQNVLGMTLIDTMKNDSFTLYFLGYEHQTGKRGEREGLLELTHNHGTENDPDFHYHNGNDKPQGYGHIGISVENVEEACARFERLGVRFQKRLTGTYPFGSPQMARCARSVRGFIAGDSHDSLPVGPWYVPRTADTQTTTGSRSSRSSSKSRIATSRTGGRPNYETCKKPTSRKYKRREYHRAAKQPRTDLQLVVPQGVLVDACKTEQRTLPRLPTAGEREIAVAQCRQKRRRVRLRAWGRRGIFGALGLRLLAEQRLCSGSRLHNLLARECLGGHGWASADAVGLGTSTAAVGVQ